MKSNRLFEITTILLNKGSATASELAARFGVSTRTIYRDIDALSLAGVPVYTTKGNGGGIYLLETYAMNRTLISERESENLLLAVKTLQATQYPQFDVLLEKLGAVFKNAARQDWVEVDFSPWGSPLNENTFQDIKKAMLERRVLRFEYVDGDGCKSSRLVEPEKLIFKSNAWYLRVFCRQRQAQRTFRISRMKHLEVTDEAFIPQNVSQQQESEDSARQPFVALQLRVQSRAVSRLYDYFDERYFSTNTDGSFMLTVELPEGEWLYSYILSFGSSVEVMAPDHVRHVILERLRQTLQLYEVHLQI